MHLNTTPAPPAAMPCMRDLNELIYVRLCPKLVKLSPLEELARHLHEIVADYPHLREEAPLVLQGEERRRHRYSGGLTVAHSHAEVA